jgi:two-component system chemotaxis response regulator CheV
MSSKRNSIGDVVKVGTNLMELIEFIVIKENKFGEKKKCHYGINVFKVCEVIKVPEIIPLPDEIPYIEGMFNLRDENIPLLNLIDRLDGKQQEWEKNIVIVAEFNNIYIGLLVHEVVQIHRISWQNILQAPKMTSSPEKDLIIGVAKLSNENSLVILDFEKIVNEINPVTDVEVKNLNISQEIKTSNKQFHILLADDSALVRKQMTDLIEKLGFSITVKKNGKEALDQLLEYKKEALEKNIPINKFVALVITDIEMPQMDGYTLTHKIKSDVLLANLPVVMHTSLSGENVKLRGKEVGADEYITKFSVDHIKKTLSHVIEEWYS